MYFGWKQLLSSEETTASLWDLPANWERTPDKKLIFTSSGRLCCSSLRENTGEVFWRDSQDCLALSSLPLTLILANTDINPQPSGGINRLVARPGVPRWSLAWLCHGMTGNSTISSFMTGHHHQASSSQLTKWPPSSNRGEKNLSIKCSEEADISEVLNTTYNTLHIFQGEFPKQP